MRGLTSGQWLILLVAWLGWVFDVMDTALFNFAKGPMLIEMLGGKDAYKHLGPAIEGRIQAVFLIGWAIGGLAFGILADRFGRTRTLVVTILMYASLTGLTSLCRTPDQVLVVRFLTALGIGGEWAAGAALIAEALPDRVRASASAFLQSAAAFGPWFAATINLGVPAGNWRTLFLVGVNPALLCVVIRWFVKEPEHRTAKNRSIGPLQELIASARWRRNVSVATCLGIVGVAGAGIVPFWLPNLIREAGQGLSPEALKQFTSYNTYTLHIGTLLGVVAFPWLAQRFGRRPVFAVFFFLAPLTLATVVLGHPSLNRLLFGLPIASFFSIGLTAGFVLYFPELFPSRLRATGAGLAYNAGRIFAAPLPALIGGFIGQHDNNVALGVGIAGSIYLLGIIASLFAPETRGLPLPE